MELVKRFQSLDICIGSIVFSHNKHYGFISNENREHIDTCFKYHIQNGPFSCDSFCFVVSAAPAGHLTQISQLALLLL